MATSPTNNRFQSGFVSKLQRLEMITASRSAQIDYFKCTCAYFNHTYKGREMLVYCEKNYKCGI